MDQFLTPEEWNIDNLFKGKYIIPIYQRPYSWGENEVKQLLKDIYLSYQLFITSQSGDTSVKNEEMLLFTGTLFIKTNRNVKNEYTEYDIVLYGFAMYAACLLHIGCFVAYSIQEI